jgi:hypothetical protein
MQVFQRSANNLARLSIGGGILLVLVVLTGWVSFNNSPLVRTRQNALEQPVPFSHQHHVAGLGLDCRYCHTSVEVSAFAGIPPTQTCMNCHSQVWATAEMLEPVRASFRNDESIQWNRVHRLADFAKFNHSIHVSKGFGCETCHGRVDRMPLVWQEKPLTMSWCMECHRNPEKFIRPKDKVFEMGWRAENQKELGARLVEQYGIRRVEYCSACHY